MGVRSVRRGVGAVGAAALCVGFVAVTGVSGAGAAAGCNAVSGISDVAVTEGDGFLGLPKTVYVVVTLDSPSVGGETLVVSTFDGSATAPSDYGAKTVQITFGKNQRQRNIAINIKGDTVAEPTESFTVDIVAASGFPCGVTAAPGTVTIVNDD